MSPSQPVSESFDCGALALKHLPMNSYKSCKLCCQLAFHCATNTKNTALHSTLTSACVCYVTPAVWLGLLQRLMTFTNVPQWLFYLWCCDRHRNEWRTGSLLRSDHANLAVSPSCRTSGRRTPTTCVPTSWPCWRAARTPSSAAWWESTPWPRSAGPCYELTSEPWWLSGRPAADTPTRKLVRSKLLKTPNIYCICTDPHFWLLPGKWN